MSHFFKHSEPDDDQPIVLMTAPTGSAAFQIYLGEEKSDAIEI